MVSFTGVPIGGTSTLAHGLTLNGVSVVPDLVFLQYPTSFELAASTVLTITLRNTANTVGDCLAYVSAIHPAIRLLGLQPDDGLMTQGMTPRPFCPGSPNAGGGGGGTAQAFDYTVTGVEPDRSAITITIPSAMADANYEVIATIQGGPALAGIGVSGKTAADFVLDATGNLPVGEVIGFIVLPKT
jgi:hypothetical protein